MVFALVSMLMLSASVTQAQVSNVFNMPTGQTSLQFVTVGDPGNAPDTTVESDGTTGYGSVGYVYQMGEYDVTVGQYVQFLNAVAKTDNYGLYNVNMGPDDYYSAVGISRSGNSGSYNYSVTGSNPQAANFPVFDVTWGDAARFCNWLQNAQPSYAAGTPGEVAGSTETGAYTLSGDTSSYLETRNAGARYVIPSENEWYKAAYFNPSSSSYAVYPTQNNTAPGNTLPDTGNNANIVVNGNYADPTNYLTPVGDFSASPGPFGTFDMGGDLFQWNEAIIDGEYRGLRGGDWINNSNYLASSYRGYNYQAGEIASVGFRVASVPEPGSLLMLLAFTGMALRYWRRRHR
jgi:formylglycine-generating enzyme required for sulfatase activity